MKTIHLEKQRLDLEAVMTLAEEEPLLLLTPDGKEFFITEADDFEREVDALRASSAFQKFLDERSASRIRIPLEEIEKQIETELEEQKRTA